MKKKVNRIVVVTYVLMFAYCFMPFKTEKAKRTDENELLLSFDDSYCGKIFVIEKGQLDVPLKLKESSISTQVLIIDSGHEILNQLPYEILIDRKLIVSYRVLEIEKLDSNISECGSLYKIEVLDWFPSKTIARYWIVSSSTYVIVIGLLFTYILMSIIIKLRKEKLNK